jgi:hypothetical protein
VRSTFLVLCHFSIERASSGDAAKSKRRRKSKIWKRIRIKKE